MKIPSAPVRPATAQLATVANARVLLAILLLALSASTAAGQSVLVQVTELETGDPIPGAFVSLMDDSGPYPLPGFRWKPIKYAASVRTRPL